MREEFERESFALELTPEVAKLEKPAARIIETIRSNLENGDYGLIVGDDLSGRLPTELFARISDRVYKKKGFEPAKRIHVLGQRNLSQEQIHTRAEQIFREIQALSADPRKRAMVVTEQLATGESVEPTLIALQKMGSDTDLVTLHVDSSRFTPRLYSKYPLRLINGDSQTAARGLRDKYDLAGIKKADSPESLYSHPNVSELSQKALQDLDVVIERVLGKYGL